MISQYIMESLYQPTKAKKYDLRTLGSLSIEGENLTNTKAKLLLVIGAVEQREKKPLKKDIYNLLWPDSQNPNASGSTACSMIRKSLTDVLDKQLKETLTVHNIRLDIFSLEEAVVQVRQKVALKKNIETILDLYRGPFLNKGENLEKPLRDNSILYDWITTYSSMYESFYWESIITYLKETGDLAVTELAFKTIQDFPMTDEYLNLFYATFVYRRSYLKNSVYSKIRETIDDDYEQMTYLQAKALLQSCIICELKEETDLVISPPKSSSKTELAKTPEYYLNSNQRHIQSNISLSNLTIVIVILLILTGGYTAALLIESITNAEPQNGKSNITLIWFIISSIIQILMFFTFCIIRRFSKN